MTQSLTDPQLFECLKKALESWPLYRSLVYTGAESTAVLPDVISIECESCNGEQRWERTNLGLGATDRSGFREATYRCRNCKERTLRIYFYWSRIKDEFLFEKVGQYPPLEERLPALLQKQLEGQDLDFYKKALRCRNFNYGLAALAYLRRVVENRMNDLLDLIAESAKQSGFAEETLKRLEQVKASRVFDEKVTYATLILPPHLRPDGQNPIDLLHDIASEGIHSKSDEECLDTFDRSRIVFENLFMKLKISAAEAKDFAEKLKKLHRKPSAKS